MSASDEIKDAIVHYFDCTDVKGTKPADWKRTAKGKLPNGEEYRTFHNAKINRTVTTLGDDEDCTIAEHDQWIYGVGPVEERMRFNGVVGALYICFEPQDRFLRTGCIFDQHQQGLLNTLFGLPDNIGEDMENSFSYASADYNELTIHILLKKLGFKFSKELSDYLTQHTAPSTVATGPDRSITFPAMNPNFTPPSVPAPQPSGPAPSTNSGSKAVRPINKMPGQVFAQKQAQMQSQQQAMMAQIGQMAAQLGATGGVQIGNTHIPAAPLMPGMRPLVGTAPLPPSGVFNSPGMQGAIPKLGGNYPELVNLQPAVQAAFIAQRVMGNQGLEQENTNWPDGPTILRALQAGNYLQVERSNIIWALYEDTDDGSGTPLEDYFAMDEDDLFDTFVEHFGLDEDDADELEVIDDTQVYPSPYDLPVPQVPPFVPNTGLGAPKPHITGLGGGRPAPMVGPASINARSGSFAPVAPPPPPANVPAAPPPGNAKADISADSGDKWQEFCKEVWDTYDVNKTNLPLDLHWYDRYRPRDGQITGLGYEFVRREFTGIVVKMGYLGRDGELLENIDLPSAVLEELLKEWGGSWNVDDITQEINKRKGENPDTGFSYTSEQLWEEVREYLDQQGWKEAK